ncbi:MAG TPA: signal peptidase I [Nocardioidaceae bacterium]|nr:signal peptidase I [Nocardioidaceae bacterium]
MSRAGKSGAAPEGRFGRFLFETVLLVAVAVAVAALLRIFVVQAFVVPSGSMLPTIEQTDRIVVSKLSDAERGDVVVFEDPGGWLPAGERPGERTGLLGRALEFVGVLPASDTGYLVKRLMGLPGDRVACCDDRGRVTVNGEPLNERYLPRGSAPSVQRFDVVVPRDAIWVMGDNRSNSGDSRPHLADGTAFVPQRNVVGPAFAIVWPLSEIAGLDAPSTFTDVPDADRPAPRRPVVRRSPG